MKKLASFLLIVLAAISHNAESQDYLETSLTNAARAKDLVSRLTLEEKVQQMMMNSPAIERLNIPPYEWWNEALHGVGRSGVATVFPQAIGLGATFDEELAYRVSSAISDEARAMYNASLKRVITTDTMDSPFGHRTSIFSVTPGGGAARKLTVKIHF